MKIAGRVIQDKKITKNTDEQFNCTYKKYRISIYLIEKGHTNRYGIDVMNHRHNSILRTVTNRCTMRDVIIYGLAAIGVELEKPLTNK